MATSKRPRKKYRPQPSMLANPLEYVLGGLTPLTQQADYVAKWELQVHTSLDSLLRGSGTPHDMSVMIGTQSLCAAILAKLKRGVEYVDVLAEAHQAIAALADRYPAEKRYVCQANEGEALRTLVELLEAYIDTLSVRDMEQVRAVALRNMRGVVSNKGQPTGNTRIPGMGMRV